MSEAELLGWQGIMVYLEAEGVRLSPLSLEMAALGRALGHESGQDVFGILAAPENFKVEALKGLPLNKIILYQAADLNYFKAHIQATALVEAINEIRPSVVLVGASERGKDVAPMAAAHFRTGLTADCTGLEIRPDRKLLQTRPAFGGNVMAEILTPLARPQFATIRSGAIKAPWNDVKVEAEIIIQHLPPMRPDGLSIIKTERLEDKLTLAGSRLIIAVGNGLKAVSDLGLFEELAKKMGGRLAGSRSLVEKGWLPPESQIGLSGHSIAPDLLITFGLSGSIQFMAGIGGAGYIIAVNDDPGAMIFSAAHLGICADMYEVLPALLDKFKSN